MGTNLVKIRAQLKKVYLCYFQERFSKLGNVPSFSIFWWRLLFNSEYTKNY